MMDEEDGVVNRRGKTKGLSKKKEQQRLLLLQGESVEDLCS